MHVIFSRWLRENREPRLIENFERLRAAFRLCLSRYPFEIEAIVVLPDHLHTVWRLPEGDANFSKRWMVIKRKFSAGLPSRVVSDSKTNKREKGVWQRRFWEHCIRDENDPGGSTWTIFTLILLNMVMFLHRRIGCIAHLIRLSVKDGMSVAFY